MQVCTPARTEGEGIHPSVHLKKLLASLIGRASHTHPHPRTRAYLCACVRTCAWLGGWAGRDGTGRMLHTSFSVRTSVHRCSEGMHGTQAGQVCPTYKYRHSLTERETHTRMQTYLRPYGREQGS